RVGEERSGGRRGDRHAGYRARRDRGPQRIEQEREQEQQAERSELGERLEVERVRVQSAAVAEVLGRLEPVAAVAPRAGPEHWVGTVLVPGDPEVGGSGFRRRR